MTIDKSWIKLANRRSLEFQDGLKQFVERARNYVNEQGCVSCPCNRCNNFDTQTINIVEWHIFRYGFQQRYETWVYHGEHVIPSINEDLSTANDGADEMVDVL